MIKELTEKQRRLCQNCKWRVKEQEQIVFCPFVHNCKRRYPESKTILIEKGKDK